MSTKGRPVAFILVVFSGLSLLSEGPLRGASGPEFTLGTIQKAYEEIRDIKGTFVQKSTIRDLNRTDTYRGSFVISVPSRMRWQYHGDNKQDTEVVINSGEIIIYQKNEKQVFRGRFDRENYGQAPMALLGGFGSIEKDFEVNTKEGKLVLRPKDSMGGVVSVEISPSAGEFPIGALTIIDKRSNRIEITFRDVVLNSGVKGAVFSFTPPKGVSVYEYPGH